MCTMFVNGILEFSIVVSGETVASPYSGSNFVRQYFLIAGIPMTMSHGSCSSMIQNKLFKTNFVLEYVIINSLIVQHLYEETDVPLASVIVKGVDTSLILDAHILLIKLAEEPLSSRVVQFGGPSCPS